MTSLTRRSFIAGSAAVAGLAVVGAVPASAQTVDPNEADIGFCKDMTAHHVQALAMCQRVLGTDTGDSVQAAAAEVLQNQAVEVGMMRAWLADWGESTKIPKMAMGWMGMHDGMGMATSMMPGLASDEEMRQLSISEGTTKGKLWLELMRTHHLSGVDMANAAVERASSEKVIRLAGLQSEIQTFEISQYDLLLAGEYSAA